MSEQNTPLEWSIPLESSLLASFEPGGALSGDTRRMAPGELWESRAKPDGSWVDYLAQWADEALGEPTSPEFDKFDIWTIEQAREAFLRAKEEA